MLVSNEALRREIQAWACSVGVDLDVLADAAYYSPNASLACVDLARACSVMDADARGCASQAKGAQLRRHALLIRAKTLRSSPACARDAR